MTRSPTRRQILEGAGAALLAGALPPACAAVGASGADNAAAPGAAGESTLAPRPTPAAARAPGTAPDGPLIVSTWVFGEAANVAALAALEAGVEHPVEACEAGVRVVEADPTGRSVGLGGLPNAAGEVELDACVMRGDSLACGGVAALKDTLHPVSVARAVMERTIHVLLVGDGAQRFAREQGFPHHDLLIPETRAAWERWKLEQVRPPPEDDHDTIGQIVFHRGRFGMAVTTSGRAWKLPGRVGDSPIIGAGGYCDDEAGACVSTGVGEEVIRVCGSFAVVELMRQGASAADACRVVARRVGRNLERAGKREQVAFLAVDRAGGVVGVCTTGDFKYALTDAAGTRLVPSEVVW